MSITASENLALVRLFIKKSGIRQFSLVWSRQYLSAYQNNQNIASGLKVKLHIQFLKILPRRGYL